MFNLSESIAALADKIDRGGRLSRSEAKTFLSEAPLALLGLLATHAKERKSGKAVFYNRNFHIEPTNVCVFNCRFCPTAARPTRPTRGIIPKRRSSRR
ncbi:MAG: hypothetical protein ACLTZY_05310 [Alistipes indistinctus]